MARNVNVTVTSENDGTTRDNVPDYLINFDVTWIDNNGDPQQAAVSDYFLADLLNWLRTNHPAAARQYMEQISFAIARVKYGIDDITQLG